MLFTNLHRLFSGSLFRTRPRQTKTPLCAAYKAMLAAAVLLCGAAVRRVRGEIHLGSGLGRIGIGYVRHGSLVAKMYFGFPFACRNGKAT